MRYLLSKVAAFGFVISTLALGIPPLHAVSPESMEQGRQLFERDWQQQNPTLGSDGLGPLFNAKSCVACHNQGGVGGGGDSRFNAQSIGIDSIEFSNAKGSSPRNSIKLDLIRSFYPMFVGPNGSVINTASVPHHGGTPEFESWRTELMSRVTTQMSEEGGPADAGEVRLGTESPIIFQNSIVGNSVTIRARLFQRNTTSMFGAGLIDSIPADAIQRQAKIQQRHPEISGRPSILRSGLVGRFGWRANSASLIQFVDQACANELSLETKRRRQATDPSRPGYRNPSIDISDLQIELMTQFVASLPRPIEKMPTGTDAIAEVHRGREVFHSVGCAVCHLPKLGDVDRLYSDMLLHDMGKNLYDYDAAEPHVLRQELALDIRMVQGSFRVAYYGMATAVTSSNASVPDRFISPRRSTQTLDFVTRATGRSERSVVGTEALLVKTALFRDEVGIDRTLKPSNTSQEWRTPPLWGVRDSAPYMHDGRAGTLLESVAMHDGESKATRDRFLLLPLVDRRAMITFLETMVAPPNAIQR